MQIHFSPGLVHRLLRKISGCLWVAISARRSSATLPLRHLALHRKRKAGLSQLVIHFLLQEQVHWLSFTEPILRPD